MHKYLVTLPIESLGTAFLRECEYSRMVYSIEVVGTDTAAGVLYALVFRDKVVKDGWRTDEYTVTEDMCNKWLNSLQRFGTIAAYRVEE